MSVSGLAGSDAVQVLDPATNKIVAQVPVGPSPHHPLFTPDGKFGLVVSQGDGMLNIIDTATTTVTMKVAVGKLPHWISINPAGTVAWVTNEGSNDITVVDLVKGVATATIPIGNAPRKIVVQSQTSASCKGDVKTAIAGFAFAPTLTVSTGQTVVWTNADAVPHTVTSDTGLWDSGDLAQNASYQWTFNSPGVYNYHCMHHPYMKLIVIHKSIYAVFSGISNSRFVDVIPA